MMELPEDILRLIREFSRPCFRFFKQYKRALYIHHRNQWPLLKLALLRNPLSVLNALDVYERALHGYRDSLIRFELGDPFTILDKQGTLHRAKDTLSSILLDDSFL